MTAIYVVSVFEGDAAGIPTGRSTPHIAFLEKERAERWVDKYMARPGGAEFWIRPAGASITAVELDTGAVNAPDDLGADP